MEPFTLLIKPSGSNCNIDCRYCFYKGRSPAFGRGRQRMGDATLEKLVEEYMRSGLPVLGFAWQGGEPTLMGVEFFQRAVELQKRYGTSGQQVSNTFQTNGVLLDETWCRFFRENHFLLGMSIDGPARYHDRYRVDRSGAGTFARVMRGIRLCKEHGVESSALILLNDENVEDPDALFDFVLREDLGYVQFIPCLERDPRTGGPAGFSITARQYGNFLCRLFDLWWDHGPQRVNIRDFDSVTTYLVLGRHTMCTYSEQCAGFVVVEHNGDAFPCEFFVEPEWRLGNLSDTPLIELAAGRRRRAFARRKETLSGRCRLCRYVDLCRGGCPKDRMRLDGTGWDRESHFCEGYRQFFGYTLPRFARIAEAIEKGYPARRTRSPEKVRLRIP